MTETHTTSGAKRYTLIIIRIALSGCSIAPEVELIYPEIDNNPVMMAEVNPALSVQRNFLQKSNFPDECDFSTDQILLRLLKIQIQWNLMVQVQVLG